MLVDLVFRISDAIDNGRTPTTILRKAATEFGELAEEIDIREGNSMKDPGKDGIVGEGVDLILCVLDLIHTAEPDVSAEDIGRIAEAKGQKWLDTAKILMDRRSVALPDDQV